MPTEGTPATGSLEMAQHTLLAALETLVLSGRDLMIQYDEEDGFWIAEVERGAMAVGLHVMDASADMAPLPSLAAAVEEAVRWNNKEACGPFSWRTRIDLETAPRCPRCDRANVAKHGETCVICSPAPDRAPIATGLVDAVAADLAHAFWTPTPDGGEAREHTVWTDTVCGTFVRCAACGYEWNGPHRTTCRSCDADGINAAFAAFAEGSDGPAPDRGAVPGVYGPGQAQQGATLEPVAWIIEHAGLPQAARVVTLDRARADAVRNRPTHTVTPLYDHPAPAQQPDVEREHAMREIIAKHMLAYSVAVEDFERRREDGEPAPIVDDWANDALREIEALSTIRAPSPEPQGETARREWVPVKDHDIPGYWFCEFCTEDMPADAPRYVGPWQTAEGEQVPETWACANCVENFLPETSAKFRRNDFAPTPAQGETEVQP